MSLRSIVVLTAAFGILACAQTFEVAAVKPTEGKATSCSGGPGTTDPGMWRCSNVRLAVLIGIAYHLERYQYRPLDWMLDSRYGYDVDAKVPSDTTIQQFRLMQQDLLVQRFHLQFHAQPEEMPVTEITLAKRGLLKESTAPAPEQRDFVPGPSSSFDGSMHWKVTNVSMEDIVPIFALQLGGPVKDSTGLKGRYDLDLRWYREITGEQKSRLEGMGETVTTGEGGPTLRQAVQSQLGLKLDMKKGMIPVMRIDHAEKVPSEN